mmetsp:Transcript_60084/g.158045  ORF Transcript_60084/g.158045 Transcript_60084/m.158045 type:complete len:252 (+) Transcript_60084:218-973(+)
MPRKTSGFSSLNMQAFAERPLRSPPSHWGLTTLDMIFSMMLCMHSGSGRGRKAIFSPMPSCGASGACWPSISRTFWRTSSKSSLSASMVSDMAVAWKPTWPISCCLVHLPLPAQNISASSTGFSLTMVTPSITFGDSSSCLHACGQPWPSLHEASIFAMAISVTCLAMRSVHSWQATSWPTMGSSRKALRACSRCSDTKELKVCRKSAWTGAAASRSASAAADRIATRGGRRRTRKGAVNVGGGPIVGRGV